MGEHNSNILEVSANNLPEGIQIGGYIIKDKIGENWEVGLTAKNLLDPQRKRYQDQENLGEEYLVSSFKTGLNLSLGLTYKF